MTCYELYALHERIEFLNECCKLLNEEWKKSDGMRLRNLEESCDELPTSLILIEKRNDQERLIGHAKFTKVVNEDNAVFLSSVIISKSRRRQGLGTKLLQMIENYLRKTKYKLVYLKTDKPKFYENVGYVKAQPVENVHNHSLEKRISELKHHMNSKKSNFEEEITKESDKSLETGMPSNENLNIRNETPIIIPPPPPPVQIFPSQQKIKPQNKASLYNKQSVWLKREIT